MVGVLADGNATGPVGWVDTLNSGLGRNLVSGKDFPCRTGLRQVDHSGGG